MKILTNQKQELPVTVMFVNVSEENEHSLEKTFHRCFVPSVGLFGQVVSDENTLPQQASLVSDWSI
jgi:hypothetical protein